MLLLLLYALILSDEEVLLLLHHHHLSLSLLFPTMMITTKEMALMYDVFVGHDPYFYHIQRPFKLLSGTQIFIYFKRDVVDAQKRRKQEIERDWGRGWGLEVGGWR